MKAGQIQARRRDECRQPRDEIQRLEDHVRRPVAVRGFQRVSDVAALAPADLPKEEARFDLPIALGVLAASGQIKNAELERWEFLGELALDGSLRPVKGCLPAILKARAAGRRLVLPSANAEEASLVADAEVRLAGHLTEVVAALNGTAELARPGPATAVEDDRALDLYDVVGQHRARRALEICAAGGHNLLFMGPPGTGKTLLASRLPGILPPMSEAEALEAAAVASIAGLGLEPARWRKRRFRSPHHTASGIALVGGGCQLHQLMRLHNK